MQVKNYKAGENYVAYNADTVEVCAELDEGSVDYIIYSPPFSSLYTFSNDERDMSNCANHDEFFEHFDYLVKSLYRALAPGRLMSVHCMNLPTTKTQTALLGLVIFAAILFGAFGVLGLFITLRFASGKTRLWQCSEQRHWAYYINSSAKIRLCRAKESPTI